MTDIDPSFLIPILLNVAGAIALIAATVLLGRWAQRGTKRAMERSDLDPTLVRFFPSVARYLVLIVGGIAVLSVFGISVASLAAVLAAGAFAIGLALQGTLAHFASGVMLLLFRPFSVGDKVSVAGITGKVVEIGLFTTLFDTPDNRRIIVPNGSIFGSTIENVTYHQTRRVDVAVGTDYGTDLDKTRTVLEEAAAQTEGGLSEPQPVVYLSELGASSIDWSVRVWAQTEDYWDVRERLTKRVKDALDEQKIGIPYPQMDVHFDEAATEDNETSNMESAP